MRESSVEQKLREHIERQGGLCLKWVSPGRRGVPDRIVFLPGRISFVELKRPGEKPEPHQLRFHTLLRRFGFEVLVIDHPDQIKECFPCKSSC